MEYTYHCKSCDETMIINHSMKDAAHTKCPMCDAEALERLIVNTPALKFKGTGFYNTDYKKKTGGSWEDDKHAKVAAEQYMEEAKIRSVK